VPRQRFFSPRFHYTFGPHQPMLRIPAGTALTITCPDSDNVLPDGTPLSREQRHCDRSSSLEANPMAGPIWVEGAEPGDSLIVHIDAIHLDRQLGQTLLAPAHGLLPADLLLGPAVADAPQSVPRHLYRWKFDAAQRYATLENPLGDDAVSVRLEPFVGCLGVCPPARRHVSTLLSGTFGGNMDLPISVAGASIYLPVFHEGGLLMLGDLHAAQGHGEIIGGAIETSGRVDCTFKLRKGLPIDAPRIADAEHLSGVGVDADLRQAIQRAYAHLVQWLVELGMNRFDAFNLVSQTASVVVGNLLGPPYPVAARIPRAALPQRCQSGAREDHG
jgi:amidase